MMSAERIPSLASLRAPPDFDQPGSEHGIADLYGSVPIDQLAAVLPLQMYHWDADSVLVSAMADAKRRSTDVLQSVRGWGSSMIGTLAPD